MTTTREVVYSRSHRAEIEDQPIGDIDRDDLFLQFFAQSRSYTMTSKEVMFSTYQAARYVAERQIPGDLVECGFLAGWKRAARRPHHAQDGAATAQVVVRGVRAQTSGLAL